MNEPSNMAAAEDAGGIQSMAPVFGSFVSGVAVTFATRIAILGCALASSVIVARWLGPEGTGALAVLNVTAALALQLGSAGMPSAAAYFIARNRNSLRRVWGTGLKFTLAAGILIAVVIIGAGKLRPELFNGISAQLVMIAAISIPFQLLTLLGLNVLLAVDRIRLMNLLDALSSFLLFVNAIVMLVIWRRNLVTLLTGNTAVAIVVSLLLVWSLARLSAREVPAPAIADRSLLKQMLVYGVKFYVSTFAGFVIFRADLLIVNRFGGAPAAGVYAIASQVSFLLMMLPTVIASLLFPRVASRQEEAAEYAVRVTRHTSFTMLLVCVAAAGASFALPVVYGASFGDATIQLLILLPGIFLVSLESVLVQYFAGTGLPAAIPVFWVITMVVNIALNLASVPRWGARAAAVNSSLSYALIFLLVAIYFRQKTRHSLFTLWLPLLRTRAD